MSSTIITTVAAVIVLCAATPSAQTQSQAPEPSHQAAANAALAWAAPAVPPSHPESPVASAPPPTVAPRDPAAAQGHSCQMAANHGQLDALVAAMNGAVGPAKIDAIAAVVNALVAAHGGPCGMMSHGSHH